MSAPTESPAEPVTRPWLWPVGIALLAIAVSASGILNQYTQDDIAIISTNAPLHTLRSIPRFFRESYWPPPFIPSLYRPFALVSLALQWAAGGGAPIVFRIVGYLLYAACSVGVFYLARLMLPVVAAGMVAALFAVHPVHVEAVALGVNQNEVWVGLLSCIAVAIYVRTRRLGGPFPAGRQLQVTALYLSACLLKENALVLPGLLAAAELLLVGGGEPILRRLSQTRRLVLLLVLVAVAFTWVRMLVLGGDFVGAYAADGLVGLDRTGRAITMLAVVPHWFRLMLWPAHLQADYGPEELVSQTQWGAAQTLGLALLLGAVLMAVLAWRRAPVIAFGLVWCAVGLFPVHNVLVPTGIVLAERTMFLPSIGVMIALGGAGALVLERSRPAGELLLGIAAGAALILGAWRTSTRHPVWSDQFNLWYQTANEDAPRSFRAHEALADAYFQVGVERMAEQEYQLAVQFTPKTLVRTKLEYADRLRQRGFCYPAARLYREAISVRADVLAAHASLLACALDLGLYREAALQARIGIAWDWERPVFVMALATADSAQRASAPPGTVRLKVPPSFTIAKFLIVGDRK